MNTDRIQRMNAPIQLSICNIDLMKFKLYITFIYVIIYILVKLFVFCISNYIIYIVSYNN